MSLRAQAPQVYSQYFINPYIYNPALAGIEGHHAIFLMYRYQWLGIEGAPQVAHINWHAPILHGLNLGAMLTSERLGALQSNTLKTSAAYLVNLDGTHFFRFGLSAGVGWNSLDFDQLSGSDIALSTDVRQTLLGNRQDRLFFIADFGMMYHFNRFNVGISLPSLVRYNTLGTQFFSTVRPIPSKSLGPLDNVLFKINYRQSMANDALAFEPQFLYRYAQAGRNQYEGALILHIKHLIWVGAGYRQYEGLVGLTGFKVAEMVGFGYSYDAGIAGSDISNYSSGTHEVHLGFHIGNRRRHAQHHSSFIKSHAKTKEEREAEAEAKEQAELEALLAHPDLVGISPSRENIYEGAETDDLALLEDKTALLEGEGEGLDADESGDIDGIGGAGGIGGVGGAGGVDPLEIPAAVPSFGAGAEDEVAQASETPYEASDSGTEGFAWGAVAQQGNSRLELPPGSYVIVGSFKVYENAVRYSEYLLQKGAITQVGYNSERGFYYIDAFYSRDLMETRRTRDRMRQNPLFSDAWVISIVSPGTTLPTNGPTEAAPYFQTNRSAETQPTQAIEDQTEPEEVPLEEETSLDDELEGANLDEVDISEEPLAEDELLEGIDEEPLPEGKS